MTKRVALSLLLPLSCLAILVGPAAADEDPYEGTVPKEVLDQFDSGATKDWDKRVPLIDPAEIWSLRSDDDSTAQRLTIRFLAKPISTPQQEVLVNWVREGNVVVIWGTACPWAAGIFPGLDTFEPIQGEAFTLARHEVNTDVHDLGFEVHDITQGGPLVRGFTHYPPDTEVIVSSASGVMAGRVPLGRGSVCFACIPEEQIWDRGADRYRWTLNFRQWTLGLPVPGAADTRVPTPEPDESN